MSELLTSLSALDGVHVIAAWFGLAALLFAVPGLAVALGKTEPAESPSERLGRSANR